MRHAAASSTSFGEWIGVHSAACTAQHAQRSMHSAAHATRRRRLAGGPLAAHRNKQSCAQQQRQLQASAASLVDTGMPQPLKKEAQADYQPEPASHLGSHCQHATHVEGTLQRLGVWGAQRVAQRATGCGRGETGSQPDRSVSGDSRAACALCCCAPGASLQGLAACRERLPLGVCIPIDLCSLLVFPLCPPTPPHHTHPHTPTHTPPPHTHTPSGRCGGSCVSASSTLWCRSRSSGE
jgi:hypothetical protein